MKKKKRFAFEKKKQVRSKRESNRTEVLGSCYQEMPKTREGVL